MLFAADLPIWLVRGFAFVLGALWGSFFNVAIYRWPRGMSVVSPPSHCPSCGAPVRWYLNVPIVGYALLGGRARCCGAKLTPRYVWVELLTAVLFMATASQVFARADAEAELNATLIEALIYCIFVGGLIIATFVDLEWMEIPDEVSLPGAALALITVTMRTDPGPVSAAIGAGFGFLVVQVLFVWIYENVTGRRGMGEGDAKLLAMIGGFLGWESILFCLVAGSAQGLVVAGIGMATGTALIPKRPDEEEEEGETHANASLASGAPTRITNDSPKAGGTKGDTESNAQLTLGLSVPPTSDATGAKATPRPSLPSEASGGPAMMVFGPMLALAALEYFFFGPTILSWLAEAFSS